MMKMMMIAMMMVMMMTTMIDGDGDDNGDGDDDDDDAAVTIVYLRGHRCTKRVTDHKNMKMITMVEEDELRCSQSSESFDNITMFDDYYEELFH